MPILKPTNEFRWRKATEEELNQETYPLSTKQAGEYYILEQLWVSLSVIDDKRIKEWVAVPIADESENG